MASLERKTIFLTGATRGIGRALALRLAREKAHLALCGRDPEALAEVAALVEGLALRPPFAGMFDLAREAAVLGFYAEARAELGPPDVLINNAGFNTRKAPLHEVKTDEFDSIMAVNLRAPFLLMREVFPDMKARGGGHVVNILSTVCHADMETMGAYTAAKAGLQALTRVFRKEVRPHNIRVSAVYPGGTDTSFRSGRRPDYMSPESVAEAVCALLVLPDDLVVHEFTFRPMVESNF
jgi:NAD(P)-dependent dehydrogenase (short-subunit alcohol dehydrogenase family)